MEFVWSISFIWSVWFVWKHDLLREGKGVETTGGERFALECNQFDLFLDSGFHRNDNSFDTPIRGQYLPRDNPGFLETGVGTTGVTIFYILTSGEP